jgi:hypothetical protein
MRAYCVCKRAKATRASDGISSACERRQTFHVSAILHPMAYMMHCKRTQYDAAGLYSTVERTACAAVWYVATSTSRALTIECMSVGVPMLNVQISSRIFCMHGMQPTFIFISSNGPGSALTSCITWSNVSNAWGVKNANLLWRLRISSHS